MSKQCAVCGITDLRMTKGYCQKHYARLKRYGNPTYSPVTQGCSVEGCDRRHVGKGMCHLHREQIKRWGEIRPKLTAREKFWAKVSQIEYGCWIWTGRADEKGYGLFSAKIGDFKFGLAHRYAYFLTFGIDKDLFKFYVCHKCDNPSCVRPSHLFLGTATDNMADMVKKNRSAKGENHSQAKLKDAQVKQIKLLIKRNVTIKAIAWLYDVAPATIRDIAKGKTWTHLERATNECFCGDHE